MKVALLIACLAVTACSGAAPTETTAGAGVDGCADVVAVMATPDGNTVEGVTTYRFDVTVQSDDRGWDKYADRWEVLTEQGDVLGGRILAHPHENEQPFTRSQAGIAVPVPAVVVRAHDSVLGFCGATMNIPIP